MSITCGFQHNRECVFLWIWDWGVTCHLNSSPKNADVEKNGTDAQSMESRKCEYFTQSQSKTGRKKPCSMRDRRPHVEFVFKFSSLSSRRIKVLFSTYGTKHFSRVKPKPKLKARDAEDNGNFDLKFPEILKIKKMLREMLNNIWRCWWWLGWNERPKGYTSFNCKDNTKLFFSYIWKRETRKHKEWVFCLSKTDLAC